MNSSPRRPSLWPHGVGICVAVWLICLAAPAGAQGRRVVSVGVAGNQQIKDEVILGVVSTREGDELNTARLQRDVQAIQDLGWFRFVPDPAIQSVEGGVRVVFVVVEYPVVQRIEFTGNTVFKEAELQQAIHMPAGQVFNVKSWDTAVEAVSQLYRSKGYVADVLDNTDEEQFQQEGILKAQIVEVSIEAVRVTGLRKTRPGVVTRMLRQKAGSLYNTAQLARDYQDLRNTEWFETITPRPEVSQPGKVIITWEFTEKRTGQISLSVGYSPREQLLGRAEIAETNFRGRGQTVRISGEIGSFLSAGPSWDLSFFEPWLTKDRTSLGVNLFDKLVYRFSRSLGSIPGRGRDLNRYFERHTGGIFTLGRPLGWDVTTRFRYELIDTSELPKETDFPRQDGTVGALALLFSHSTRDYSANPTQGSIRNASVEFGLANINGGNTGDVGSGAFNKLVLDLRRYVGLKQNPHKQEPDRERYAQKIPVLAFRLMMGGSTGGLPFTEQFFLGGAESLRGYLEDRFWGRYMFLGSAEYRRPVAERIGAVLFVDVGDAWGTQSAFQFRRKSLRTRFEQHSGLSPRGAVGVGLRVATPIGPIRLDFGVGQEGARTHFSIGHSF
ncbi:MAG: BamA/TamA family outer membrane protein [Armatimonadetes bacterium]|nr:BamA/TamA family outer membrane protein [Armatimonadota bacterium]